MIPFEEIDNRLAEIGKNRAWLAAASGRKLRSIGDALAPSSADTSKRSPLLQKALTDAIEREEARQAETNRNPFETQPKIPAGHTAIYLTGQLYEDAERASRIVDAPTLSAFCLDVIQTQARLIIAANKEKANGTNG